TQPCRARELKSCATAGLPPAINRSSVSPRSKLSTLPPLNAHRSDASGDEAFKPVEHRLGVRWQIVVTIEAPVRAVDPDEVLLIGRHRVENRLHVSGRGQRVVADLQEQRR